MSSTESVQTLLRFLSQDAKLPLAQALPKVKNLQAASLTTASDLSKASFSTLTAIFADEKVARQVLNAAKRVCKKRSASDTLTSETSSPLSQPAPPSSKKHKPLSKQPSNDSNLETSLALPAPELDEEKLKAIVLFTNRAPLVLAFALVLTKFSMPEQPLSSRLSLAQAVTSMNSKSKAVSIGIETGRVAEDEGWGVGQPIVRVMTRDIRVMRRWGYNGNSVVESSTSTRGPVEEEDTGTSNQDTGVGDPKPTEQALWAIDLEALRKANYSVSESSSGGQLPIYKPQAARSYLLKAFESPKVPAEITEEGGTSAKRTAATISAKKERNLALLLGALELLFRSWASLSKEELDRKAWGWYVRVRPDVAHGPAGWGGKGNVKLSDILELRRPD
ncbi:hypothetical protein T440DRAFT_421251 [Plenodomus tracheiphilus IPT5]|uniref:Impact N-terminal domain-containing protein n=1 Tax=Plenodomus tracheiphilus IPT5 TaxID=1408161 RepID=A0A6A7BC78_9PLEO|nr:hypothetical protein T440DRAFT_421251 [Plenodomus tracheiphilus IPT5]